MTHATAEVEHIGRAGSITIDFVPSRGYSAGRLRERHPGPTGLDPISALRPSRAPVGVPAGAPTRASWSPACMAGEEYELWQRMNPKRDRIPLFQLAATPCEDSEDPAFVLERLA